MFAPEQAALAADQIMLARVRELARQRANFAFETTLAGCSLVPSLRGLIDSGYEFHLLFLWLPSAELAIDRVASRIRLGGHHVLEGTIRRRYERGLRNFFFLYRPLATSWQILDNSVDDGPNLIAAGSGERVTQILIPRLWQQIQRDFGK